MQNKLQAFLAQWRDRRPTVTVHTSGSTGTPKQMQVEKSRMRASARRTCQYLGLQAGDSALLCMDLDYIGAKMMVVRALEADLVLTTIKPSSHPLATVGDEGFDFAAMVPMQVYNSLSDATERRRLSMIKNLIIGGGAISPGLEAELRKLPNRIYSTYGMTETLSHIALRRINGSGASDWYTPFDGVDVAVDDTGRLTIYAPEVCPQPLVTNDRAEIADDNRRFKILGRIDNVICSGGVKMQIEVIEQLLRGHLECEYMITKSDDEKFGEVVTILYTGGDESDLRDICSRVLPKYMQPRIYIEIDTLPMTPNGKPARAQAVAIAAVRAKKMACAHYAADLEPKDCSSKR